MNILVFSWRDIKHPKAGGAEQVMHEHAKGWVSVGHKVIHFSSKMDGLLKSETIDGIVFVRAGYQYLGVQIAGFFYYLKNRKRIDFVVDEFHGVPFFTPLYAREPKLAVIQEVAREVWFLNPLPRPLNWLIGMIGFIGEPLIFLFYRNVQFMIGSESAKQDVSKFRIPLKNITVVPHGVILPKLKAKSKKLKVKTITYLGVLSKDKGIEDAIRCFKILDGLGDFKFWVIGKPETYTYGEKVKNLVSKLKLEGQVKFWGFVTQEKKFELLAKSHVLVNPSVHEGWGLVNIEANSVGTPVVAYKSAGLVDSVNDGVSGIFCREKTPQAMAEALYSLLTNTKRLAKISTTAIFWSKQFSWAKARAQSLKLIGNMA